MRNLLEFMKSEGYTPEQIKELKEFVNEQELAKINKGIFFRPLVICGPPCCGEGSNFI